MACGDDGPKLDWADYPNHLKVARNKLQTTIAGDFARWIVEHYGYEAGYRLPFVDEVDINIILLEWLGIDQSAFAAEHADMLRKQEEWEKTR